MISSLRTHILTSRPRFWPYLLGPFAIGVILAVQGEPISSATLLPLLVAGLYFSFPANLLIYGVNDLFDYETDIRNAKKQGYETLVAPETHGRLLRTILLTHLPFLLLLLISPLRFSPLFLLGIAGFLFFGIFYSAPPIRAKVRPFLDAFFNILYAFPALVGMAIITPTFPLSSLSVSACLAATFWCMAMHAFSAVPDISADREAGYQTIATRLGKNGTLLLCLGLYLASGILVTPILGITPFLLGIGYALLMSRALFASEQRLFKQYKQFPTFNLLAGGILFWTIILRLW